MERRSRISSATEGFRARNNDSESPAQSWNSNHTKAGLFTAVRASATRGLKVAGRASVAVIAEQYFKNERRSTPAMRRRLMRSGVVDLPGDSSPASDRQDSVLLEGGIRELPFRAQ